MSDDVIYRREAINAISCDITVTGRQNAELVAATIGAFADRIKALPSAQPDIIRCKDCKYASPNGKYGCKAYHFKLYETHEMEADDFCSRAERRTDD